MLPLQASQDDPEGNGAPGPATASPKAAAGPDGLAATEAVADDRGCTLAPAAHGEKRRGRPCGRQVAWLRRGLGQPGGKLPLFDEDGQRVSPRIVRSCLKRGWAEPWFANPLKPDWLVCKLTPAGRAVALAGAISRESVEG